MNIEHLYQTIAKIVGDRENLNIKIKVVLNEEAV